MVIVSIVSAMLAFTVAVFRFVYQIRETKDKQEVLLLKNRIAQYQKQESIDLALERIKKEKELLKVEIRVNSYPRVNATLNFLLILTTAITLVFVIKNGL